MFGLRGEGRGVEESRIKLTGNKEYGWGCAWVGLRGFFDPTHHGGSKKIQPNPWVGLGQVEPMSWTIFFITIIIKLG